ncbi:Gfo/Idh/MocA family protein [Companilactobacillus alimentarius]|uniref:NAD(P)-dependent oxidoreductase n=1 Tax=Companilactobacillus alimentarius DSM 20249 TaxID=1423720 RepID=A0A2K9HEI3_9LACO|nr:Gfo/Idh/MocA family oxidoreductase [Companilactobacillus alimentarius]AUI70778.1 NAD(P)-dependent oxidoreductase [Companilactobacillus alimentarius DSM 20249]KRK77646.1 oxidoreductase [Companilactobacillus alimentarius DSM 20249]GEO45270.1 NAD(P)-dependent oxidoreductase [Companilactobacillus alimentarius]
MKLAILGAGMIVKDFLSMIHDIPEIELTAIMGTPNDLERMQEFQKENQIGKIYTDIAECLKDPEVDTVYVALPNFLHYKFAKLALEAGKNVICEKPFTLNTFQLEELSNLAQTKKLILVEAITNQYLNNYRSLKSDLSKLGSLKVIECNYSQYSHRYDAFLAGTILPAFDPKKGGGALMDLNIYNIHFIVGLLGAPKTVHYYANVSRGIDTSGVLVLEYPEVKVVCIAAKDCSAEVTSTIQGNLGSIVVDEPTNVLDNYEIHLNGESAQVVDNKAHSHRMYEEFVTFNKMIEQHDLIEAQKRMKHSLDVMKVVDSALSDSGIKLG